MRDNNPRLREVGEWGKAYHSGPPLLQWRSKIRVHLPGNDYQAMELVEGSNVKIQRQLDGSSGRLLLEDVLTIFICHLPTL